MAIRKPLVIISGVVQELPVADSIPSTLIRHHITSNVTVADGESYVVASPMEIDAGIIFEVAAGGHAMVL